MLKTSQNCYIIGISRNLKIEYQSKAFIKENKLQHNWVEYLLASTHLISCVKIPESVYEIFFEVQHM